jgi:hypothetical protein
MMLFLFSYLKLKTIFKIQSLEDGEASYFKESTSLFILNTQHQKNIYKLRHKKDE